MTSNDIPSLVTFIRFPLAGSLAYCSWLMTSNDIQSLAAFIRFPLPLLCMMLSVLLQVELLKWKRLWYTMLSACQVMAPAVGLLAAVKTC